MDATKVFDDLTWDDVVIEHGVLKAIQEFSVKDLKHKDLHAVCSWLEYIQFHFQDSHLGCPYLHSLH